MTTQSSNPEQDPEQRLMRHLADLTAGLPPDLVLRAMEAGHATRMALAEVEAAQKRADAALAHQRAVEAELTAAMAAATEAGLR